MSDLYIQQCDYCDWRNDVVPAGMRYASGTQKNCPACHAGLPVKRVRRSIQINPDRKRSGKPFNGTEIFNVEV